MIQTEGRFSGARGLSIYYQYWTPETAPRALLLVVLGSGEHCARYRELARYFTGRGFAVAALDHGEPPEAAHAQLEQVASEAALPDAVSTALRAFVASCLRARTEGGAALGGEVQRAGAALNAALATAELGYYLVGPWQAALPYLLSGHGGSGSDGWPHDAPLSCGVARGSPMGAPARAMCSSRSRRAPPQHRSRPR